MSTIEHTARAHALLSASSASRWISCPPSARIQEHISDTRSTYAEEGTTAHELSELMLRGRLFHCNSDMRKELDEKLEHLKANEFYGAEMENAAQEYVELVEERYMGAKVRSRDAVLLIEERLDFTEWVPDGFGTGDVVIVSDGVLEVIDLKYGKGVPVSAVNNSQLRIYGLGAWSAYGYLYDIHEIHMTIIQPRLDNVSTDVITVKDLLTWAETVVKPAAGQAFAGEGPFKSGEHCRWCKVKGNCRARADENMEAIRYEFQDPALMNNDEISSILFIADQLQTWAKDVQEHAYRQALAGERFPLWKLVEGRSNRKIMDVEQAKTVLESANLSADRYLKPRELFGIGDLEKRIGKKELSTLLADLIVKPQGKPVLVPETDKRPELNSVDSEFSGEDFEV